MIFRFGTDTTNEDMRTFSWHYRLSHCKSWESPEVGKCDVFHLKQKGGCETKTSDPFAIKYTSNSKINHVRILQDA